MTSNSGLVGHDDDSVVDDEISGWVIAAARGADDKLALNTLVVDVGEVLGITDYFLITAGANPRQVRAIANNIEEAVVHSGGPKAIRREGQDTNEWVLLDFGSFICHVFIEEHRAYYELERLWGDRPRLAWAPIDGPNEVSADDESGGSAAVSEEE